MTLREAIDWFKCHQTRFLADAKAGLPEARHLLVAAMVFAYSKPEDGIINLYFTDAVETYSKACCSQERTQ